MFLAQTEFDITSRSQRKGACSPLRAFVRWCKKYLSTVNSAHTYKNHLWTQDKRRR